MAVTYATSACAEQLGISKTSLQHYITILEEHGYEVSRNSRMHRQFSNDDVLILRAFLTLTKDLGLKLKDAAQTVTAPSFEPSNVLQQGHELMPAPTRSTNADFSLPSAQFEDLSNSMELIATHIYGIEQQNAQLLTLIEEQRTQNELLLEQNKTLKQQFGVMMQHIVDQANTAPAPTHAQITATPNVDQQRQLDRLEQQNNAIMNVLNKLTVAQSESTPPQQELEKQRGLFGKFFK